MNSKRAFVAVMDIGVMHPLSTASQKLKLLRRG